MSEKTPDVDAYVYQPDPPKKHGRIYAIGGIPSRLTQDEAEAIVDAINEIGWIGTHCHACKHVSNLGSDHCPKCSAKRAAPWRGRL